MSIIYEQTPGGLYPTGPRTVTTFPSGLIRVDRTFACKTSVAPTHRATLAVGSNFPGDSYPAMDGLKIFPEPQEKRRDDGFTEFTVSGYGRTKATASVSHKIKTVDLGYTGFSVYETTGSVCVPSNSGIHYPELNLASSYSDPFSPFDRYQGDYNSSISFNPSYEKNLTRIKYDGTSYNLRSRYCLFQVNDITAKSFWLIDPLIEYSKESEFGSFKEIYFVASPSISFFFNSL